MAAEAADTIVGFLHRVHRQDRAPPPSPRALYDDNPVFNDSVDEAHGSIRIFEIEFRPSEVLFQMEPESYRIYLAEFSQETERTAADDGSPRRRRRHDGERRHRVRRRGSRPRLAGERRLAGRARRRTSRPAMPAAERDDYGEVVLAQRLRDALARLNPALARRGAGGRLPQAHAARRRGPRRAQPRAAPPAGGRRDGRVPRRRGRDPRRAGAGDRLRRARRTTTGWRSTSSPSSRTSTRAGRTWCCSSTACRWRCSSSRTRPTRTPRSGRAFQQLQTYKAEIPSLFATNALLVVSDGVEARVGTLTAGREWFKPWRTIAGETLADAASAASCRW